MNLLNWRLGDKVQDIRPGPSKADDCYLAELELPTNCAYLRPARSRIQVAKHRFVFIRRNRRKHLRRDTWVDCPGMSEQHVEVARHFLVVVRISFCRFAGEPEVSRKVLVDRERAAIVDNCTQFAAVIIARSRADKRYDVIRTGGGCVATR